MRSKLFIVAISISLLSCSKSKKNTCVDPKTDDFKKTCCSKDAKVSEYTFQGNTVYVFDPGNCGADMTSEVTNAKCETIGYLGGISGNTKINGEDFSKAKYKKTVWSN